MRSRAQRREHQPDSTGDVDSTWGPNARVAGEAVLHTAAGRPDRE